MRLIFTKKKPFSRIKQKYPKLQKKFCIADREIKFFSKKICLQNKIKKRRNQPRIKKVQNAFE